MHNLTYFPDCDICKAPNAVFYQHTGGFSEFFCPSCLKKRATFDAAYSHLQNLLENAVMDWLKV